MRARSPSSPSRARRATAPEMARPGEWKGMTFFRSIALTKVSAIPRPRPRSSYVSSWLTFLRTHELVGENRFKFAAQLGEMSDELAVMSKEVDKNRKVAKDLAAKLDKGLQEQEQLVDRVRLGALFVTWLCSQLLIPSPDGANRHERASTLRQKTSSASSFSSRANSSRRPPSRTAVPPRAAPPRKVVRSARPCRSSRARRTRRSTPSRRKRSGRGWARLRTRSGRRSRGCKSRSRNTFRRSCQRS